MADLITPSIILLSASPGSGKSYMIKYLLKTLCAKGRFELGLVFCQTVFNEGYDYLPKKAVSMYNENKLKKFILSQKKLIEEGNPRDAFLILDDCIGAIKWNSDLWTHIITTFRHYRITIFISTQYVYKIPPVVRACAFYSFVYSPQEGRTINALWETFGMTMSKQQFTDMLIQNTGNYYAILIDNKQNDASQRYKKIKAPQMSDFKINF